MPSHALPFGGGDHETEHKTENTKSTKSKACPALGLLIVLADVAAYTRGTREADREQSDAFLARYVGTLKAMNDVTELFV